jgi:Tol biopolymer transport system component
LLVVAAAALLGAVAAGSHAGPARGRASAPLLVFASDRTHDYLPEIYTAALRPGAQPLDLSRDPHSDQALSFDPRSGALLFASDRSGSLALYTTSSNAFAPPRLFARLPSDISSVHGAWSAGNVVVASLYTTSFRAAIETFTSSGRPLALMVGDQLDTGSFGPPDAIPFSADRHLLAFTLGIRPRFDHVSVADIRGKVLWRAPGDEARWAAAAPIIAISTQGSTVRASGTTVIADERGRTLRRFVGEATALSADGTMVALARGADSVIASTRTGAARPLPRGRISIASFSPDGRTLEVVYLSDAVKLVAVASGRVVATLPGYGEWLPGGQRLAVLREWPQPPTISIVTTRGEVLRRIRLTGAGEEVDAAVLSSSAGDRIVYTAQGIHAHQLYERLPGGQLRALTDGLIDHTQPAASPDGREIADVEYGVPCGNCLPQQASVLPVDGSAPAKALPLVSDIAEHPTWSPDGLSVAVGQNDAEYAGILIGRVDGSAHSTPAAGSGGRDPAWSPDGSTIAFVSSDGLAAMSPDGSHARLLVSGTAVGGQPSLRTPTWSPDGSTIAFAAQNGIDAVSADGSGLHTVLSIAHVSSVAWSPDGSTLAFSAACAPACSGDEIWTVHADGSGLMRVTDNLADDTTPAWLPGP